PNQTPLTRTLVGADQISIDLASIQGLAPIYGLPPTHNLSSAHVPQTNQARATSQPIQWLWQNRIPLTGVTLLDGDHGTGKSLLSLRIAAAVSSGSRMPDGTPTIQGGVVIISPVTDANTAQLPQLIAFGAD